VDKATATLEKLPGLTIRLTISIPKAKVNDLYQELLKRAISQLETPGFRKGRVPGKIAEEKIDRAKLDQELIRQLVPESYFEAIKDHNLAPIINPKIKIISSEKDKDWQIEALTCEAPTVTLGDYKGELTKSLAGSKIWLPGQKKDKGEREREEKLKKILEILVSFIKLEVPRLLLEDEVNRKLSELIDKTDRLRLSLDQYLTSINQTADQLREAYGKEAEETLKIEFILSQIANEEKIIVDPKEIEAFIAAIKDEKEREALETQKYLIAQIIRRRKTFDFLLNF